MTDFDRQTGCVPFPNHSLILYWGGRPLVLLVEAQQSFCVSAFGLQRPRCRLGMPCLLRAQLDRGVIWSHVLFLPGVRHSAFIAALYCTIPYRGAAVSSLRADVSVKCRKHRMLAEREMCM